MSANSPKYIEKVIIIFYVYFPNSFKQKNYDISKILKNKLVDLDKCFYYQNCSYNQIGYFE